MDIPVEIVQEAEEEDNRNLMPEKSRNRYYKELSDFNEWRTKTDASLVLSENTVLAYISSMSKKYKASTVWTKFSMLKKAFIVNGDVDISRFGKVMAFMKKQNINFVPKKFKILGVADCRRFILEASDDFLLCKVVLIFGLYGACRRDELLNLTIDDIEDHGKYVLVKVAHTSRSFIIPDASESFNPYEIYQKYVKLRPRDVGIRRFFLGYRQGKCVAQPAGMHTIGGVPRKVAEFLGLDHPELYTGHCLRRSGARFSGNILPGMQGGWKSSNVPEGYIEEPIRDPINITSNDFAAASSSREEFSYGNAEFHKTGKDYQPYLNDIGSHLLAAFKDQSKSLQYNDQMNEEYPLINPDPDTPTVTGLPNPYEDDNISFSTDSSNPMKDTYVSVKPDPDTPMVTGLSDSYDNDDMSYKTDNIEPDIQLSIKPDPDTPMVTDLTNPYDNADTSYSTDHNDPMTDTPPSPESDFVTPIASTCLQTIVPDSDPESQKPPSVLKRKFKKQLNYKDLYYKKMYELACFELKSKKVIHTLDVKIKKKQLEQLEN